MDREKRFHDLLDRALRVVTEERQTFLDQIDSQEVELVREVRQALDAEAELSELRLRTEVIEDALGDRDEPAAARTEAGRPVPERVGHYRIEDRLGRGGMGEVYRGFDERLGRPVALKHVVTDLEGSSVALERLRREARSMALLSHRAIVQIHDWVESDDGCWYVMELVEGRTLKQVIDGQPLEAMRVITIGRAVTEGLAAAHAAGILHRDLKAENVMIGDQGAVKLLDFGLAKSLQKRSQELTLTAEGQIVGTVSAMSPEQTTGDRLDERSDLFSLGILLYQAATGVSPFLGVTTMQTVANICRATQTPAIERNPEVPRPLSDLIDRLLAKQPDRRPANAREVLARLRRMATRTGVEQPRDLDVARRLVWSRSAA